MKATLATLGWILAEFALSTYPAEGQNLLSSPAFTLGNTGFSSTYTYYTGPDLPEGRYVIEARPIDHNPLQGNFGDHTTGNGLMMVANGGTLSNWYDFPVWSETVNVEPDNTYSFSGFLTTADSLDSSPADIQVTINGQVVIPDFISPTLGGDWQQMQATWNATSDSSATISLHDMNTAQNGNDFALDDVYFSQTSGVPEPASVPAFLVS